MCNQFSLIISGVCPSIFRLESKLTLSQENPHNKIATLLERFPEYRKTLSLAVVHEDLGGKSRNYQGWQWHDVEIHPTKLIRLVTEGLTRINLRTRQATYYLLRERDTVRKIVKGLD